MLLPLNGFQVIGANIRLQDNKAEENVSEDLASTNLNKKIKHCPIGLTAA